ncbi:hypothetical protein B7463_g3827, partial [Scytalidium lignicola]
MPVALGNILARLADLTLISIDKETQTVSLHRLVQIEFRLYNDENDHQRNFDAAVQLLLQVFPSRDRSRIIEDNWPIAEFYLPQVLALIENYRKEKTIRSSKNLCELICNASWYLFLNDTSKSLEMVLKSGFIAYKNLDDCEKDALIYAYLLCNAGLHDLDLGEFHGAQRQSEECLQIQLSKLAPTDEHIVNSYNNLGIIYGSMADYDRGSEFLEKASEALGDDTRKNPRKRILLNMNIARNLYCMGKFNEAQAYLQKALADADALESKFWAHSVYIGFESLFFRMGNLDEAEKYLILAEQKLELRGEAQMTPRKARYAYQAGRLALQQGRFQMSIENFNHALDIIQFCDMSIGHRARVLFALSKALQAANNRKEEAAKCLRNALLLRDEVKDARAEVLADDSFEAFDLLVKINDR